MKTPASFVEALSAIDLVDTFQSLRRFLPIHDLPEAAKYRERTYGAVSRAQLTRGSIRSDCPRPRIHLVAGVQDTLDRQAHLGAAARLFGGITLDRATVGQTIAERQLRSHGNF